MRKSTTAQWPLWLLIGLILYLAWFFSNNPNAQFLP